MKSLYQRHRFPPEIISHAVWLYHRFTLSFRDVEDLLAERGVSRSYEAIRSWCGKFGPSYAHTLRRRRGRLGDIWHMDELFIMIRGERHCLWRAVDQDGDVLGAIVRADDWVSGGVNKIEFRLVFEEVAHPLPVPAGNRAHHTNPRLADRHGWKVWHAGPRSGSDREKALLISLIN